MAKDALCNTVPAHIQRHSPCPRRQAACGCLHSSSARPAMRCVEPRSFAIPLHHSIHHRLRIPCRRAEKPCVRKAANANRGECSCEVLLVWSQPPRPHFICASPQLAAATWPTCVDRAAIKAPPRSRDGDGALHPAHQNCNRCPLMAFVNLSTCCSADKKGSRKLGCCSPS